MTEPRPGTGQQNEATAPTPQAVFHHHHPNPALLPSSQSTTHSDAALSRNAAAPIHTVDGTFHHAGSDPGRSESQPLPGMQSSCNPHTRQPAYASTNASPQQQPLLPPMYTSSSASQHAPVRPLSGSVLQRCRSVVQSAFGSSNAAALTSCPSCSSGTKPTAPLIATMADPSLDDQFPVLDEAFQRSRGEMLTGEASPRGGPASACSLGTEPPPSYASSAGTRRDTAASSSQPPSSDRGLPPLAGSSHLTPDDSEAAALAATTKEALVRGAASCVSATQARCEAAEVALNEARREVSEAKDYEREILDSRAPSGAGAAEGPPLPPEPASSSAPAPHTDDAVGSDPAREAQLELEARAAVSMALRVLVSSAPGPVRAVADKVAGATLNMTDFDVFAASNAVSYIVQEWNVYISEGSPFHDFDRVAALAVAAYEGGRFVSFQLAWKAAVANALAERNASMGHLSPTPVSLLSASYPALVAESPSVTVPAAVERELSARMDAERAAVLELHSERARNTALSARIRALESEQPTSHPQHRRGPQTAMPPPPPPFTSPPPPPPPATPPGRYGSAGALVPHSPAGSEFAMMPMPEAPAWYNVGLSAGLSLPNGAEKAPDFSLIWAQGPQCREDLRRSPFTAENLCRRIAHLAKGQYAWYGNFRGVWMGDVATQWVWYRKGQRDANASDSLVASMLSAALQAHAAFSSDAHRLIKIEVSSDMTASDKIANLFWETDKLMVPRKRASMLLVLQSFRWEDDQSAETLWHAMDAARVVHNESPQALCEQYLSAVAAVATAEDKSGNGAGNPSARWLLAVNILSLVEDLLSRASPDTKLLEEIRLVLDKDRKDAKTPLPSAPRVRKEARMYVTEGKDLYLDAEPEEVDTATMRKLRDLELSQRRQSEVFAAFMQGSGANRGRTREHKHLGIPGCADVKYIISTGKVFPANFFAWEFNPARADGKVDHTACPGCPSHVPPITVTYEYKEAVDMNDGHPPTRRSDNNPGPRTLQQHEAIWHLIGKCYDVWDEIWRFVHEHPDDPDSARFKTPLTDRELQDRLKEHKRSRGSA